MFYRFRQNLSEKLVYLCLAVSCGVVSVGAQVSLCGDQPGIAVSNGIYNVINNEFNSAAPECIDVTDKGFRVTQSAITSGSPGGYPSIYKGCHWGVCTSQSGLPIQVSTLAGLKSDWATIQPASGQYVAAYDLWFNTTPATQKRPDGAELMIWVNRVGGLLPAGSRAASNVKISGASYNVYLKKDEHYIAYVKTQAATSVENLDLQAFIKDAASRGYIQREWYLICVAAGFELWQGGAGLATNSFSVTAENSLSKAKLKVWWPADQAKVSGTQSFKARLDKTPITAYRMYWSVDGGKSNLMADSSEGFEHKEASIDFSSWRWSDGGDYYGPFLVTFTAEDLSGVTAVQKTIRLYVAK